VNAILTAPVAAISGAFDLEIVSWSWGGYAPAPVKPAVAGAIVQQIVSRGDDPTPSALLEEAKAPDSPLHGCFEWDDGVAGRKHRESQAVDIFNHLYVSYRKPDGQVLPEQRYIVKVKQDASPPENDVVERALTKHVYTPSVTVAEEPNLRRRFIFQRYQELAAFRRRNASIQEFHRVFAEIDALASKFDPAS
jgi:hypothetical protein